MRSSQPTRIWQAYYPVITNAFYYVNQKRISLALVEEYVPICSRVENMVTELGNPTMLVYHKI